MKKLILLFTFLSLTIGSAAAKLFSVSATLNASNMVPALSNSNTATCIGTFDDISGSLNFTFTHSTLVSNSFHYNFYVGEAGTNGTISQTLFSDSNIFTSSITLSSNEILSLKAGSFYVVIDNTSPFGEIRGQITVGIEIFNQAARNDFYGIGGYSFSKPTFTPSGFKTEPLVITGPSPENSFTLVASTADKSGLYYDDFGGLTTNFTNKQIRFDLKGNNIKKWGADVFATLADGSFTSGDITVVGTTNLGNTATLIANNSQRFVGFDAIAEDEYIVSVTATPDGTFAGTKYVTIEKLIFGDDKPQNVALNFDGVDDYVEIPSSVGNIGTNDNFTVSCWIKPDATQPTSDSNPDENDIISKWAGLGAGVNNNYPFVIRYLNTTRANVFERGKILVGQWDGTTFTTITSNAAVNDGNWHHVAFVRGETGFSLYIDGALQGSAVADNANGNTTNTTPLQIGRRGNGQNYFKGEIDEVRIWTIAKDAPTIANERFCKTPDATNLQAAYNFSNGVPHDNNPLISQIQDAVSTNHGTLNNFALTGDASNFVTGQVKYVRSGSIFGNTNGSSWTDAFTNLQSALVANNSCNDLLFDVYVARTSVPYRPSSTDIDVSFNIPSGMSIYGGFAGTEKSINQRNKALIQTTNETTLSGDLNSNDILSDFTQNRTDNSKTVVNVNGKSNIILDGFSIRGGFGGGGGGINALGSQNIRINHCKIFDNSANYGGGISADNANNLMISQTYLLGNRALSLGDAIYFESNNLTISMALSNCVVAGHTGTAIRTYAFSVGTDGTVNHSYTNCTFANNGTAFLIQTDLGATNNFTLKNSIVYGNTTGIDVIDNVGTYNQNITYSLLQGVTSGTGNLNGNTVNPQFVNPTYINPDNAGDYRLKWCSKAIGAGDNAGISPLDLDGNPRNFNGTADMGAFEFLGNTPSPTNATNSSITGTIDMPVYAGGAIQSISSTAKILAPAGKIDFKAPNSILLSPGFEARGMSNYFKAEIGANVGCVN